MNLKVESKVLITYITLLLITYAMFSGDLSQIEPNNIGWLCVPFLPVILFTMCRKKVT